MIKDKILVIKDLNVSLLISILFVDALRPSQQFSHVHFSLLLEETSLFNKHSLHFGFFKKFIKTFILDVIMEISFIH